MIFKRLYADLRAQNWMAIAIELLIVIFGVFIGTQVSNWNDDRLRRAETRTMLAQLKPSLELMADFFVSARSYYATTRAYTGTALAGWEGRPGVSDSDFVIAAYQASQIYGFGASDSTWASTLGSDQLRNVEDPATRANLSFLMSSNYTVIDSGSVDTPYRHNVRRVIPVPVQEAIRDQCGDRPSPINKVLLQLPPRCTVRLPPDQAAKVAAALRARPSIKEDLQWHTSAVATFLFNMQPFEQATRELLGQLANHSG